MMKLNPAVRLLCVVAVLACCSCRTLPVPRPVEKSNYRGFTIDESRVQNLSTLEALRTATREQIDMACSVGMSPEILTFFQSVPFVLVPAGAIPSATPGLYSARNRTVEVTSGIVATGHKPVLLHELLHAYHDQRLPWGFGNPNILRYFERTKIIGAFAPQSHMMENPREFFACAATTYLFDVTAQEPFDRDKIKAHQPELFAYLTALFGPTAGHYMGSLTRPPTR